MEGFPTDLILGPSGGLFALGVLIGVVSTHKYYKPLIAEAVTARDKSNDELKQRYIDEIQGLRDFMEKNGGSP